MAVLEITEEQIVKVLEQLLPEQRERILHRFATAPNTLLAHKEKPLRVFGSGKTDILQILDDFDSPLSDFDEYQ